MYCIVQEALAPDAAASNLRLHRAPNLQRALGDNWRFGVWGLGFGVWGLGFRCYLHHVFVIGQGAASARVSTIRASTSRSKAHGMQTQEEHM